MAQIMTDVLGRPIRFQQVTAEAYRDRMVETGMSGAMAQGLLDMALTKDAGFVNAIERTPHNSSTTTFRAWCTEVLKPAVLS